VLAGFIDRAGDYPGRWHIGSLAVGPSGSRLSIFNLCSTSVLGMGESYIQMERGLAFGQWVVGL